MKLDKDFGIREVSRRTGLSPHVIRAWEKRYGAIVPSRTETRRRRYTETDITRLTLLGCAVAAGHRISRVADLSDDALRDLTRQPADATPPTADADRLVDAALAAVERYDPRALEVILLQAGAQFSQPILLDAVLAPLLDEVGQRWQSGRLRIAQEHMATDIVRTFLGRLYLDQRTAEFAPVLVTATPVGQRHELGALMAAVAAAHTGWRVVHLGADLPAEEIAAAALAHRARAVALSLLHPADDPRLGAELERLLRLMDRSIPLLVGGRAAAGYRPAEERPGLRFLPDLAALRETLEAIRQGRPGPDTAASGGSGR
jgi:DNA-binding transcriptional MerR regulator/methylmalonyl-CoA mutase cobalamin-binding subunit